MTITVLDAQLRARTAAVLGRAADHLDDVGLHKGSYYDRRQARTEKLPPEECRTCLLGGIFYGIHQSPLPDFWPAPGGEGVYLAAMQALRRHLGNRIPAQMTLAKWSDTKERTDHEVITALRETAATLRATEGEDVETYVVDAELIDDGDLKTVDAELVDHAELVAAGETLDAEVVDGTEHAEGGA